MSQRRPVQKSVQTDVLVASRRRCCLCVFLDNLDEERKGQIAHLDRDPSNHQFRNLVYLCLDHHDEYDGRTNQSKGYIADEVRTHRDRLYARNDPHGKWTVQADKQLDEPTRSSPHEPLSEYEIVRRDFSQELLFTTAPWRFPLYQVANEPEFFAYKASNRADGICLIERIDLPDGRIVIACIETAGNPGISITNSVEELCFQVCERFEISPSRLVWLEHYDYYDWNYWSVVSFGQMPPDGPFADPKWTDMSPELWRDLQLKPKKKLRSSQKGFSSKLTKLFPWPTEPLY